MSSQSSIVPNADKAQPWKKWLVEEMEISSANGENTMRPWTTWKPNPQDPSEKPWLYWRAPENALNNDDGKRPRTPPDRPPEPEMVGTFSRFGYLGIKAVPQSSSKLI